MKQKMKRTSLIIVILAGSFLLLPQPAEAVIPPDFVFNIGSQVAQFSSMVVIFLSAVFGGFFQFFRARFASLKHKKVILALAICSILGVSIFSSYFYAVMKQNDEYKQWLSESEQYNTPVDGKEALEEYVVLSPDNANTSAEWNSVIETRDENDQLGFETQTIDVDISTDRFVATALITDDSSRFISSYYENIADGNYEQAYAMSKKSVDLATFQGWYRETSKITLDKLVRIDEKNSSLELTLFEGNGFTRYGVLMTLLIEDGAPVRVEKSEVKILVQGSFEDQQIAVNEEIVSNEYSFFESNITSNAVISNEEFKSITQNSRTDYIVLDARENIEYENGYFPGSIHIRFADLKAGRWIELPKDKFIYVLCWSGIRGKEVAEFLRTKKFVAAYLEQGASGWVEGGGTWIGNIRFAEKYTDDQYQRIYDTDDVKKKVNSGTVLVDTREPAKYKQRHIEGSVNIPMMYTASIDIDEAFRQVPPQSTVITICDGYVNCFDAKITGVELERRGHTFLGRYTKPWEYE